MQIKAQTDCIVVSLWFKDGDIVKDGAEILQVEVCKMMIPIQTSVGGTITYKCRADDYVRAGQVMAEVGVIVH